MQRVRPKFQLPETFLVSIVVDRGSVHKENTRFFIGREAFQQQAAFQRAQQKNSAADERR
jgi:hypothetical protein